MADGERLLIPFKHERFRLSQKLFHILVRAKVFYVIFTRTFYRTGVIHITNRKPRPLSVTFQKVFREDIM